MRRADQPIAGIADKWRPGIGDECHQIATFECFNKLGHNFFFIVIMQRQRPNLDANMR